MFPLLPGGLHQAVQAGRAHLEIQGAPEVTQRDETPDESWEPQKQGSSLLLSAHTAFVRAVVCQEGETDFDLSQMTLSGCFQGNCSVYFVVCFPLKITSPGMFLSLPGSSYLLVALRLPRRAQSCEKSTVRNLGAVENFSHQN